MGNSALLGQSMLDSIQRLDEVVITADRVVREVNPVQRLDGAQLQRLSSHSVADALRYFSGLQIKDYGGVGGLKTVNIRSMGTNHVGVFYDGIELGNAQNGTIDLGRFSLDNMESVTLYNGQKSAAFQPAKDFGSAGSVYLQSRTPVFEERKARLLKATVKTASFDVINPAVLWEQKLNETTNASVSAEYMHTSGRYKFTYRVKDGYDTTAVRQNGDVNALRAEVGLYGKMDDGHWKAKAYLYRSERGYPGAVVKNKFSHEDRQWDTNVFTQGSFRKDFGGFYSMLLNGKYAYDYLHYLSDPTKDESAMYVDNRYRQQEVYLSSANRFTLLSCLEACLSADCQFNLLDANLINFAYPRRHTALTVAALSLHTERWKVQASILGTFVHDVAKYDEAAGNKTEWTPSAVASFQPWKEHDFHLRAFYKRIFRMPTLNDLYYTFIGNVYLKPEYTHQYNIGVTYSKRFDEGVLRRIEWQTDAYYNEVKNKIVAIPSSNFYRWTMLNFGEVRIKGVDVAVHTDWLPANDWQLIGRLNYTYQRAQDVTDRSDPYYGGQIPYIPRHSGSAILNLTYRRWEANYSFIYTGERYSSRSNIPVNYQLSWYTSDLSFARSWKGGWKVTAEVNNLLNQQYEVVSSYPMPGINFRLTAQYTLSL
ncbi:MAG: TonB-dependent receptor [Dysgonamonadaceae bacterium]|nr:TonB-dependent receptor [Dysgonamonadaceae bacterium]